MSVLENELGLVELSPRELYDIAISDPTAENLSRIPISYHTCDLLRYVCEHDGLALECASKRLITPELCEVAIRQNGLAIRFVPRKLLFLSDKKWVMCLCELAVRQNAHALRYIPNSLLSSMDVNWIMDICGYAINQNGLLIRYVPNILLSSMDENRVIVLCEKAVTHYYSEINTVDKVKTTDIEEQETTKLTDCETYPVAYIPEKLLSRELLLKAVTYSPYCIRDIPKKRISKILVETAVKIDPLVVKYVPERYKTPEMELLYQKALQNERSSKTKHIPEITDDFLLHNDYSIKKGDERNNIKGSLQLSNDYCSLSELTTQNSDDKDIILVDNKKSIIEYDLSEESILSKNFYYIFDVHIEHQLKDYHRKLVNENKTEKEIEKAFSSRINSRIESMLGEVQQEGINDVLLIGGDVADSVELSAMFYNSIHEHWYGYTVSVLGNHELWDGSTPQDWDNPDYISRPIDEIVDSYRTVINTERFHPSVLLENELFILYKNAECRVLSEKMIINASDDDLRELLSRCSTIILGGTGYSGLNPVYNADMGLYRKAVPSLECDRWRTERFQNVYKKVNRCAYDMKVVVLTHTPVSNWLSGDCNPNWVYVNGHTHQNCILKKENGLTILSDNQLGYVPRKWRLHAFRIDSYYDPFQEYPDGIYEITPMQYKQFNVGRGIVSNGCNYYGQIFALKKNGMYMFVLRSNVSLCILEGGGRKRLKTLDPQFYYDNIDKYVNSVLEFIKPYQLFVKKVSDEVKAFGGTGIIHGCIVDIDWFSHIYVNPFDGRVTPYWAEDTSCRKSYNSIEQLLELEEPRLFKKYLSARKKDLVPLIQEYMSGEKNQKSLAAIPQWMFGHEIYEPSRIMRALQYVWDKNVIRIWNDDLLSEHNSELIIGSKHVDKKHQLHS